MVLGPGVQKTFRLSSHTPEQFNVMSIKEAIAFGKKIKNTVNCTFRSLQLRISLFTGKLLIGIYKDITTDQEKSKVFYKYKCYCDSVYIGRTSQRFHISKDQHVTKSLRIFDRYWIE